MLGNLGLAKGEKGMVCDYLALQVKWAPFKAWFSKGLLHMVVQKAGVWVDWVWGVFCVANLKH